MNKSSKTNKQLIKKMIVLGLLMVCMWMFVGMAILWQCKLPNQYIHKGFGSSCGQTEEYGKSEGLNSAGSDCELVFSSRVTCSVDCEKMGVIQAYNFNDVNAQNLAVDDNGFIVNFSREDVSNIAVTHEIIASSEYDVNDKIRKSVTNRVEECAKAKFGKDCFTMGVMQYSVYENSARMVDFSDLSSVEIEITVSGSVKNATDSYYAVFVKLDETTESAIVGGNYALLESIETQNLVAQKVICSELGKSNDGTKCLLTIDADSDGFIFILNVGNEKSGVGMIILVVGIALSLVLLIVIMQLFQSYKREKLRVNTHYNVDDVAKCANKNKSMDDGMSENSGSLSEIKTQKKQAMASTETLTAPKKPKQSLGNSKPKLPKSNSENDNKNQDVD